MIIIFLFVVIVTELDVNADSCINIDGFMYVYLQIDTIQYARFYFSNFGINNECDSMDVCTVYHAKIQIGFT